MRVALDVSCLLERPLTGVGYTACHLLRALLAVSPETQFNCFATRAHNGPRTLQDLDPSFPSAIVVPFARLLKYYLWTSSNWPPIETFCGPVDIAHGLFHDLPAARRAARVATIHDLSCFRCPETHTPRTRAVQTRLLRHSARHADALVAVSESCKNDLVELLGVPPELVRVVPGGVYLREFAGELDRQVLKAVTERLGIHGEYFIHLGTLEPRKNVPRLLRAYATLRSRCRECPKLVLVGKPGWLYQDVFDTIQRLRLHDCAIHAGYLERREAILLLRGAKACVYPSLYEGFGLPVLEAMAAGTPVITSNRAALPEVAGDAAIVVNPEDEDALTTAMESLIADSARVETMKQKGLTRAHRFTWEQSARRLLDVYRTCIKAQR
ncbi:MAG: glycosyltransferase family 4 protein [Candidatus Hydrogenedentes bacterium]|nr:glycosyltransferase family 4 protein [Candidatus Hydrogenedentota bacterium]